MIIEKAYAQLDGGYQTVNKGGAPTTIWQALTGKSGAKALEKVRAIRGVADVSPEQKVDIGPPNSRETW